MARASSADFVVTTASLGCSACGARLADGAQFCSRCGKSVSVPAKKKASPAESTQTPDASGSPSPAATSRRRTRRVIPWIILAVLISVTLWIFASDNPFAQGVQEFAGWKHDQGIVDTAFSVSPHNLRYYKFVLPQGSIHVSIVGEFRSSSDAKSARSAPQPSDSNIEVYVMSEAAFVAWQNGYATSNVYESGRVAHGSMQADLPDGAGVYYLIFNNKFAATAAKQVNADILLRYKNWLPEFFRRMNERFWTWIGV